MSKNSPKVSVVMSVYNGGERLRGAIDSILGQTFRDFEFLIINDCSTDDTEKTIRSYKDKRIKLINNFKNIGLPASLNKGIAESKGEYVTRMDADDWSFPDRFEKQIKYLEKFKKIDLLGGLVVLDNGVVLHYPADVGEIKATLTFQNPFAHPTIMFRRTSFLKNNLSYDEDYRKSQDYELWTRAIFVLKATNLDDVLLKYHIAEGSIEKIRNDKKYQANLEKIRIGYLKRLIPNLDNLSLYDVYKFRIYLKIMFSAVKDFSKIKYSLLYFKYVYSRMLKTG